MDSCSAKRFHSTSPSSRWPWRARITTLGAGQLGPPALRQAAIRIVPQTRASTKLQEHVDYHGLTLLLDNLLGGFEKQQPALMPS